MKLSRIVKVKVAQADTEEKDDFEESSHQNETKKKQITRSMCHCMTIQINASRSARFNNERLNVLDEL